ncbi:type VI secretion system baseplate subunit TssF [Chryseobacterium rhizoplanae]|uniref:type VI secretion system baseplate subunit TssF n=1 Tax=Chryseobacterium rhizoplanae TaxID=1609531 RepID=UPI001CE302F2|nr:type VI secretion system baseplate subunit TssF [Chryseobacterium rhizoplanae]UCA61767.1 type VI secretion system baseplate subunit TssF [Chryseobacterium rhizoplanae]
MNQEKIKDRILRRAAKLWGYHELRADTSFDPIVSLMLSAVSSELEKLGFELESSKARVIERVLDVLFPEEITGVMPSRSLIQVFPVENQRSISLYDHFKTEFRGVLGGQQLEQEGKEIYFCPTIEAELTTANIEYIAYGKVIKKIESPFSGTVVEKGVSSLPPAELWTGIRCPDKGDLENLMFYFDISSASQKELFLYYIKQVKICFGNCEFELTPGYNVDYHFTGFENILGRNYLELDYIYDEVNRYYSSGYFTLKEKLAFSDRGHDTELFTRYFPESELSEEEDLIWLKFQFPESVDQEILENIKIMLNCIPVINIYNVKTYRRAVGRLDILPIQCEDYFLTLDYVMDDAGRRFDLKSHSSHEQDISAILRKGGVSRFDRRNASELLQYLLDLIKDETTAFSAIGGDSAKEMLMQINQNMTALDQLAEEKNFSYIHNPYLIITGNGLRPESSYNISYWSTQAEQANHIRAGTFLVADHNSSGLACIKDSIMLTTSQGGRKNLSPEDKISAFRMALLGRGRVVTTADIREFAMSHFKDTISHIEVRKGTKKEVSLKDGFSRTIDIHVSRNAGVKETNEEEWQYLCNSFLVKLSHASTHMIPYRILEVT